MEPMPEAKAELSIGLPGNIPPTAGPSTTGAATFKISLNFIGQPLVNRTIIRKNYVMSRFSLFRCH